MDDHAAADGFIGPDSLREKDRWPHAVFFRAVLAQFEISGDERYPQALIRHYQSTPHPMDWDRDVTGVEILVNLYQEFHQPELLELARLFGEISELGEAERRACLKVLGVFAEYRRSSTKRRFG